MWFVLRDLRSLFCFVKLKKKHKQIAAATLANLPHFQSRCQEEKTRQKCFWHFRTKHATNKYRTIKTKAIAIVLTGGVPVYKHACSFAWCFGSRMKNALNSRDSDYTTLVLFGPTYIHQTPFIWCFQSEKTFTLAIPVQQKIQDILLLAALL